MTSGEESVQSEEETSDVQNVIKLTYEKLLSLMILKPNDTKLNANRQTL